MSVPKVELLVVVVAMLAMGFTSTAVARPDDRVQMTQSLEVDPSALPGPVLTGETDSAEFRVAYFDDESGSAEINFQCSGDSQIASCQAPNDVFMDDGDTAFVWVTFTASDTTGSAQLSLTANWPGGGGQGDTDWAFFTVNPAIEVVASDVPTSVTQYSEARTADFEVINHSSTSRWVTFECSWGGGACDEPDSVEVGATSSDTVAVEFDAGSILASYQLWMSAASLVGSSADTASITVTDYLTVNAVPTADPVYAEPSSTDTAMVELRFPGQSAATFHLGCTGGNCSVVGDTLRSVGDTPVEVALQYTAGSNGNTTTITLTATKADDPDVTASSELDVVATSQVILDLEGANPGRELIRSDCPNIAVGAGAIVCDDFQYAYQFTPVTRMNRTRQLAFVHNSSAIAPQGRVNLDFVLPPGGTLPDTIRARLRVAGNDITDWITTPISWQAYPASTWMGQTYSLGEQYRLAFPWSWHNVPGDPQVHDVDVIFVQVFNGGGTQIDTVSGYTTSLDRRYHLGVGWWVAGYENITPDTDPNTGDPVLVWHSGDFSTRVYERKVTGSDTLFVGWTRSRQDTIEVQGNNYVRKVLGGGEVHFDAWGFNTMTVSPKRDTTFFGTDVIGCCARLTSVSVSVPSGRDTIYALDYDATGADAGVIEAVRVVGSGGGWDTFSIAADTTYYSSSEIYIESITDPSGATTTFVQLPNWEQKPGGELGKIIRPGGDTTNIGYLWDTGIAGVDTVRVQANATAGSPAVNLVMPYAAAARVGMYWWDADMTTRPTSRVYSRLDGPDTVSTDTTAFYVTGYGGVRGVGDALGNITWVDREDEAYPAFPTRVRHPNGWEVTATYGDGGLLDSIVDRSTGGVTRYAWDEAFSVPDTIVSPEGVTTAFDYDDSTGNLLTRTVGTDKDSLHYNAAHLVDAAIDPMGRTTTFGYDVLGNLAWAETPTGVRTRHARDYLGRDTLAVSPINTSGDSMRVRSGYDIVGRPVFAVTRNDLDAKWDSVTTIYDSITGRRIQVEAVGGITASPTYEIGTSKWAYDALGRVKVATSPASADTLAYDLAGNVTQTVNNGDTTVMAYDRLGRLETRYTSGKFFPSDTLSPVFDFWTFPVFDTTELMIDTMTATYTYDVMGNLLTADNAYAQITRTYHANGLLETEQQAIREYSSGSFATHVYDLAHAYDRDGRRVGLFHPDWLSPGADRTEYAYDATTGRLSKVTDPLDHSFTFAYNADGQPKVITFPAGLDSLFYDDDGLLYRQTTRADGLSGPKSWSIVRDVAGRVWQETGITDALYEFDGLGHLVASEVEIFEGTAVQQYYTRDPFGNAIVEKDFDEIGEIDPPGSKWDHDYAGNKGGRLSESEEEWDFGTVPEPNNWVAGNAGHRYDATGNDTASWNLRYTWSYSGGVDGYANASKNTTHRVYSKGYYDAAGLLRVYQINRDSLEHDIGGTNNGPPWGAYEEYWYDALGRRILKRSRQESPICTDPDRCYNSIERFVWDGDQVLWELRQAGSGDLDQQDPSVGSQTGHVGYVHAGGLDAPLGIIRNGEGIVLHRNWKGLAMFTTDEDGNQTTCAPDPFTNCAVVSFPGASWGLTQGYKGAFDVQPWYGSLAMGQQDRSGLTYKRNRYYDPGTGQFTQQDPIGIAGGLNLYGYANGDPINFSDPFGLKSQIACRPVGDDNEGGVDPTVAHCAIRVIDEDRDIDILIELAPDIRGRNVIHTGDSSSDRARAYGDKWFDVAVPRGMSSEDFDDAVLGSALAVSSAMMGSGYSPSGSKNSNRFIYNIVTGAGGRVPFRASAGFLFAPGICGGQGPFRGNNCSR
jgi:RHS repeat-associated protein